MDTIAALAITVDSSGAVSGYRQAATAAEHLAKVDKMEADAKRLVGLQGQAVTPFCTIIRSLPSPAPRTALAEAMVSMGGTFPNLLASTLFKAMRRPDRYGVRTTINTHHYAPEWLRSCIVAEMYERRVNPNGFGLALALDWMEHSARTVAAAGTREQLLDWFRYARFDVPFVRRFCDMEAMPARTTVWRGTRTKAALAAAGMSWTPTREVAAYYASWAWRDWGHTAEPILLRREIARDQVLAYFPRHGIGEAVIDSSGAYEIDTADPDEIAALAATAEPMLAAGEERAQRCTAEILAATEDELFGEWAG